jgi:hypothetical protein
MISPPDFDYEPTFRIGKLLFLYLTKEQLIEGCNEVVALIQRR